MIVSLVNPAASRLLSNSRVFGGGKPGARLIAHRVASIRAVLVAVAWAIAAAGTASAQCHYTWTEIPNPSPNEGLNGVAINNLGHVAGEIWTFAEDRNGFFWSPERGLVRIPMPPGFQDMRVSDLNDLDHVCGTIVSHTQLTYRGYIWDGNEFTFIDMPPGATQMVVMGINNFDQVVGYVINSGGVPGHAFLWSEGVYVDLGAIEGTFTVAKAISDRIEIVGDASVPISSGFVAGLDFQAEWLPDPDGFARNFTRSLSNSRFIVGFAYRDQTNNYSRPVIWHNDEVVAVYDGPPSSTDRRLFRVNSAGRVVGHFIVAQQGRGVAWQNGIVYELSELTVPPRYVGSATDINERGEILYPTVSGRFGILYPAWLDGDLTGDCHVDFEDLLLVLSNFGSPVGSFPLGDADLDGDVDISDLAVVLSGFGE